MKTNIISEELQEWDCPHLAAAGKQMPFYVPEGYFNSLAQSIPYWTEQGEVLPAFGKINPAPFQVPENYFSDNIIDIPALAQVQLSQIEVDGSVPAGYFDNFPTQMLAQVRTIEQERAVPKKIEFRPVYRTLRRIQIAAAAVAFLIMGFLGLNYGDSTRNDGRQLALQQVSAPVLQESALPEGSIDQVQEQLLATGFDTTLPLDAQFVAGERDDLSADDILEYMTGDDISL